MGALTTASRVTLSGSGFSQLHTGSAGSPGPAVCGRGSCCKMIGNRLGGWGASCLACSWKALRCHLLVSSWCKLFQGPSFHFRKLFWPRGRVLTCHFLELEKTSPIVLGVPKDLPGLRNGTALTFVNRCPPLSLCFRTLYTGLLCRLQSIHIKSTAGCQAHSAKSKYNPLYFTREETNPERISYLGSPCRGHRWLTLIHLIFR